MHRRSRTFAALAVFGMAAALAMPGGPASGEVRALNLEEVASVAMPEATHLEFLHHTVDGVPRVFAMVGDRSLDDTGLEPGPGLNLIDITDPAVPAFVQRVPCLTSRSSTGNMDSAAVEVAHTVGGVAYDAFIAMGLNSRGGCFLNEEATGGVVVIGVRGTPEPGSVLTADFLGSPFVDEDGEPFAWVKAPAAHTVVPHPTEPVVYVGNQNLGTTTPTVEILDFATWPPVARSHALPGTGVAPHDITFKPDGTRAYASSINLSFIWDTSGDKARAPETIATLVSPNLKVHHEATLHPNGRHLFIVDETLASTGNENTYVCPGGGVHVFDLGENGEHEANPIPIGQFYTPEPAAPVLQPGPTVRRDIACTAHEFTFPPDGRWMPIAWFGAGTRVFDLSALVDGSAPLALNGLIGEIGYHTVAPTDVWASKVHPTDPTYVLESDTDFGLRVLRYTGDLP